MGYNFDLRIERRNTHSLKWDGMVRDYGTNSLLPFWVADMDFATPDFILDALRECLDRQVLGYSIKPLEYFESIKQWCASRYEWDIETHWIHFMPGVVPALALAMQYFTREGDRILVMPPIYHPFHLLPTHNGREVVWSALQYDGEGCYIFDRDRFAADAQGCKMVWLCNPHNPGGKVWTADELHFIAEVCAEAGVPVCSDEIHADLTFAPHRHTPFATVSEAAARNSITFQAPSKAFNIPGLASAHSIIPNDDLRKGFYQFIDSNELADGNLLAWTATIAAYTHGADWLAEMLHYVRGNIDFVVDHCRKHIPAIRPIIPDASYLIFLDCRALSLPQRDLELLFRDGAGLALNSGTIFGTEGKGFMRLNAGCPRATLTQGLSQLASAIAARL